MISSIRLAVLLGSIFLQSCAVVETKEIQANIDYFERQPIVASSFILSKVTKFNADGDLTAIETARIDTDENEIIYFIEDRREGTFRREQLKYSDEGLLLIRSYLGRDGQLQWSEYFQHDDENRLKSSNKSFMDSNSSASHVQSYQYEGNQLLSRTVATSFSDEISIESGVYSYLPTGHLKHLVSIQTRDGNEVISWAKFDYDEAGRIVKKTIGEGGNIDFGIVGYELYDYDSDNNVKLMTEKDDNDNTVSYTRYEYFDAGEPAFSRTQHLILYKL